MKPADGESQTEHDNNESNGAADDGVDGGVEVGEVASHFLPVGGRLVVVSPLGRQPRPEVRQSDRSYFTHCAGGHFDLVDKTLSTYNNSFHLQIP